MAIGLTGTLEPSGDANFPIVESNKIKGNAHYFADLTAANAFITNFSNRLQQGMFAYVEATGLHYTLNDALTTWDEFSGGGASELVTVADSTARLALTGYKNGQGVFQSDNETYWLVTNEADLSLTASWKLINHQRDLIVVADEPARKALTEIYNGQMVKQSDNSTLWGLSNEADINNDLSWDILADISPGSFIPLDIVSLESDIYATSVTTATIRLALDTNNLVFQRTNGTRFSLNRATTIRTAPLPGATSGQSIHSRVSSTDGGVIQVIGNDAYIVNGDGSRITRLAAGVSGLIDVGETFDVEITDVDDKIGLGDTETYSLITGDSDSKGANGLPIIQNAQPADSGANPARLVLSGGGEDTPLGKLYGKKTFQIIPYSGALLAFRESAQKGEIAMDNTSNSFMHCTKTAGIVASAIVAVVDNGNFTLELAAGEVDKLSVLDTLRISGSDEATLNGDHIVDSIDIPNDEVTIRTAYAGTPTAVGSVFNLANASYVAAQPDMTYADIWASSEAGLFSATDAEAIVIRTPDGTTYQLQGHKKTGATPGATPNQPVTPHVSSPDGGIVQVIGNTAWVINGITGQKSVISLTVVDIAEGYDVEAQIDPDNQLGLGATENYSVIRGHSDAKGANGIPVIQNMQTPSAGANQARLVIASGDAPLGQAYDKIPLAVAGYRGDALEFIKIAQRGEICLHTNNKSYQAITSSGDAAGTVATTGVGVVNLTGGEGANFVADEYIYISGCSEATANGLKAVVSVSTDELTIAGVLTGGTGGAWYKAATVTEVADGTPATI